MLPKSEKHGYQIAGIRICIEVPESEWDGDEGLLREYCKEIETADYFVSCYLVDHLSVPEGESVFRSKDRRVYRDCDRQLTFLGPVEKTLDKADCGISRQDNRTQIEFLRYTSNTRIKSRLVLGALDLPHMLIEKNGFILHASFIEHEGRAILFTAPSETGKSTQAQLWCDHRGAELVNGDRAAVRVIDGKIYACGVPFAGSSRIRKNRILPLTAIVYLSQAPENTITKLRGFRAFRSVWEGITLNTWDRDDVEKATQTLSTVLSGIPVYHLACTPDVRAVELLKQTLEVDL